MSGECVPPLGAPSVHADVWHYMTNLRQEQWQNTPEISRKDLYVRDEGASAIVSKWFLIPIDEMK